MRIDRNNGFLWSVAALLLGTSACAGGSTGGNGSAWDPQPAADSGSAEDSDGDDGAGDTMADGSGDGSDEACTPGEVESCACPDGLTLGEWVCRPDGSGFGPCACEDDGATDDGDEPDGTTDDGGSDDGGVEEDLLCFPGDANDWTTCVPFHYFDPMPDEYQYPDPYMGNDNYRRPIALIDLEEVDPATRLAPNFRLDEIAQLYKGRYAVVQPHAIESLQGLRDQVGAIGVNSGYRSPAYNAGLDGAATHSRHMYGDAFDLDPIEVGLSTLESACTSDGGMLVEYTSHVHCDFRFDPVDEDLFGPPMAALEDPSLDFNAELVYEGDGTWSAPADGFDEGEPQRRWTARDADGLVIAIGLGPQFVAPLDAVTVEVRVGAQIERAAEVSALTAG